MVRKNKMGAAAGSKRFMQRGAVMGEMMLYVVIAGVLVSAAFGIYQFVRSSVSAGDVGDKVMIMVTDIQKNWRRAGSFATVTPAEVNKLSLVRSPLRYDGTNVIDGWGNTMTLNGGPASFALTIGGATTPMQQDDCATVVARLESLAAVIRIGEDAAATGGAVTGGSVYKSGATITQAGLTDGCSDTNPIIAAQFR